MWWLPACRVRGGCADRARSGASRLRFSALAGPLAPPACPAPAAATGPAASQLLAAAGLADAVVSLCWAPTPLPAAVVPSPGQSVYAAAKSGLRAYFASMASELSDRWPLQHAAAGAGSHWPCRWCSGG